MSDPVTSVTQFLDAWADGKDGFANAVRKWFTPETVWENVGLSKTTGVDQALAMMDGMSAGGIEALRVENLAVAAQGNKVLTERIDYLMDGAGKTLIEARVMGIFEVDPNGKITRWADYFDTAAMKPQA